MREGEIHMKQLERDTSLRLRNAVTVRTKLASITEIAEKPSKVLDVGCGTGNIARYLINFVDYIDAIGFSESMITMGKSLPQGNHPNIN
jgi:ubiquinone/menaquinone biosynthesis C-methylase UbiE